MVRTSTLLLALCLALPCATASAQGYWKWRDANGTLQISDQPPPPSVPEKNIVSRPGQRSQPVTTAPVEPAAASAPSGRDSELEARLRKLKAAEAASAASDQQASRAKDQARRDENCKRARSQLAVLESGVRVIRPNDKGEREFMDDKTRADETRRVREQVASQCN